VFVFLDNVQYKKREFQNRNKIRTKEGWLWLTVPVITKGRFTQKMKEVLIDNTSNWHKKHWQSIEMNYSKAKYFNEYKEFFKSLYEKEWDKLIDLNVFIIKYINELLNIKIPVYYESDLNIEGEKTTRIINICKKLNADTYLSGIGGKEYLIEEEFIKTGIKLIYQNFKHPVYTQVYPGFEPFMSIVDLLFNCGKESKNLLYRF
jgi:hypothetical protein